MTQITVKEIVEKNSSFNGYICECGEKKLVVKDIDVTLKINTAEIMVALIYTSHTDGTHEHVGLDNGS